MRLVQPSLVRGLAPLCVGIALACALAGPVQAAQPSPAGEPAVTGTNLAVNAFLRFEVTGRDSGHLDTAVRSYGRSDGVSVALIAAVHVADRAYFDQLQRLFERYDALLYELIREGGARADVRVDTDNPVSQAQLGLKTLLNLEFQLEAINYARPNFVHADLDPETFQRLQTARGESILGLMLHAALEAEERAPDDGQSTLSAFQMFWALLRSDRSRHLKFLLGQQMGQLEAAAAGLDKGGPTVLVSDRNAKAIEVLQAQIQSGKRALGIFYGAGHMPDLERRLLELGFRRGNVEWIRAWDVGDDRRKEKG
jgi:hypothetical protein